MCAHLSLLTTSLTAPHRFCGDVLRGIQLMGTNLTTINLDGLDFSGASFAAADLRGASLEASCTARHMAAATAQGKTA